MLELLITVAAGAIGFTLARNFVRRRLRFVDAVQSPWAPLLAGIVAAILFWPAALLPMLSATTAIVFGIGTGLGTASGARLIRMQSGGRRYLNP
jgi:hypothetical protein